MNPGMFVVMMAAHQTKRMLEESRRRDEELRKRRIREEEEERERKEKEKKKLIEHRKNAPVVYNKEDWQKDRCVKAISLNSSVQNLISIIEKERPKVIEEYEKIFDNDIFEVGFNYESLRNNLEEDIDTLKSMGITIEGTKYEFSRIKPSKSLVAKIEQDKEFFGNKFTIMKGQPIEISPEILDDNGYYEKKYQEYNPEQLEKDYKKTNSRIERYNKYGKFLTFLLRTKTYSKLQDKARDINSSHDKCEVSKKELESFQSLTKEQLEVIRSYFSNLNVLSEVSSRLKVLFSVKAHLSNNHNQEVYNSTINEVMNNPEYTEVVLQVYDYITKILNNDKDTMKEVYDLVKGEYPINISNRFIYDLIISNMASLDKKDDKAK